MSIKSNTKSDELVALRRMFSDEGLFAQFSQLIQIHLILDANAVLSDLRWLVCKAKSQGARTKLLESLDSETIIAYAPTYLHVEIKKNIPVIAEEEGVDSALLFERWEVYKKKITFIESGGPVEGEIDPKDAPYVNLHKSTGFPVLTEDQHISRMGARVVNIQVTALAHSYGREAVIEYKIKAGFLGVFTITSKMIEAASGLVRSIADYVGRIPAWVLLMVIGVFIYAITFEGFRSWLKQQISVLKGNAKKIALGLYEIMEPVVLEHKSSKEKAMKIAEQLVSETDG